MPPVREPDPALRAHARPREPYPASASVVRIIESFHESAGLEPRDQPRHPGLREQHVIQELRDPEPVGCDR